LDVITDPRAPIDDKLKASLAVGLITKKQYKQNIEALNFFNEHRSDFEKKYPGLYICISNNEVFVGNSSHEATGKAMEKYPDHAWHVEQIPFR